MQYLLPRTDISQKTVVGCPWLLVFKNKANMGRRMDRALPPGQPVGGGGVPGGGGGGVPTEMSSAIN